MCGRGCRKLPTPTPTHIPGATDASSVASSSPSQSTSVALAGVWGAHPGRLILTPFSSGGGCLRAFPCSYRHILESGKSTLPCRIRPPPECAYFRGYRRYLRGQWRDSVGISELRLWTSAMLGVDHESGQCLHDLVILRHILRLVNGN